MKRTVAVLLAVFLLSGCTFSGSRINEPVSFYYQRTASDSQSYDDYFSEGIIGSEEREASGHQDNLSYLLTVYLRGPLSPEFISPFPMGCRIVEIHHQDTALTVRLNPILAEKSDLEITIACACLAKTCMELTDVDTVQIEARNLDGKILFSRILTRDNLFLRDDYTLPTEGTEITP